jgi:Tol biopolymer transport system component
MQGGGKKMVKTKPSGVLAAAGGALVAVGSLMVMLMVVEARPAEATFPGPNGKIAYSVLNSGIYTINPGGGGKSKVTDTLMSGDAKPSYSPNGKRIAYSGLDPVGGDFEIYTINVDGGDEFRLTYNDISDDFEPDYSPDGKRIAYSGYEGPDTEIYTIKVGGGGETKVTNNVKDEEAPSYSPDGEKIAYECFKALGTDDDEDFDIEICTINVGGGGKTKVTDTVGYAMDPSWARRP